MAGPPSPQLLFAPLLVGVFLSTILFGIICTQVTTYFKLYGRRDVWWLRMLVAYLFLAECSMAVSEFGIVYEPFVLRTGSLEAQMISPKMLAADGVTTVAISTPVQLYLAYRIRLVTGSYLVAILIALVSLTSFAGGISLTVNVVKSPGFATFQSFAWAPTIWLISAAVSDVLITISLVWYLSRNKSGFDKTRSLVDKIIIATIQSGLMTSFVAIATLVVFLAVPNTTLMFIWDFSLSRLYTLSLLSTLLARQKWNQLINKAASTTTASNSNFALSDIESSAARGATPGTIRSSVFRPELSQNSRTLTNHQVKSMDSLKGKMSSEWDTHPTYPPPPQIPEQQRGRTPVISPTSRTSSRVASPVSTMAASQYAVPVAGVYRGNQQVA